MVTAEVACGGGVDADAVPAVLATAAGMLLAAESPAVVSKGAWVGLVGAGAGGGGGGPAAARGGGGCTSSSGVAAPPATPGTITIWAPAADSPAAGPSATVSPAGFMMALPAVPALAPAPVPLVVVLVVVEVG